MLKLRRNALWRSYIPYWNKCFFSFHSIHSNLICKLKIIIIWLSNGYHISTFGLKFPFHKAVMSSDLKISYGADTNRNHIWIFITLYLFFKMVESLADDCSDMVIRKWIKYGFSFTPAFDEFISAKNCKLVRYCRRRHIESCGEVAGTCFGFEKHKKNSNSGRISENLE